VARAGFKLAFAADLTRGLNPIGTRCSLEPGATVVIASDRASKDARPSGQAMAKQSGERRARYVLWIASSLRSSR
jgi:hypothetical protein